MATITAILFIHLLLALALLGAITHQTISVLWPVRATSPSFGASYRAVRSAIYANPIVVLYLCVALMGSLLYPQYRISVLPWLRAHEMTPYGAVFEYKEHVVALGLGVLPIYWYLWKMVDLREQQLARNIVTAFLAFCVWFSFLYGHVLNNAKGFGS